MRLSSPRQFCINLWNVAGMLHSPYGIRRNLYTPMLPTEKVVYWRAFSDIFTCQKPLFRSMQEKCRAPTMLSIVSCIWGKGYASFLVLAFRHQKSIQKFREPSFFLTNTTALHQGDWEGRIAPPSSISWICCHTSSTNGGAMRRNLSLNGLWSSSSISCSVTFVHPISWCSREKMSWYSSSSLIA